MKVICKSECHTSGSRYWLTKGKIYDVVYQKYDNRYKLTNDAGHTVTYPVECFFTLKEARKKKLLNLNNI